MDLTHYLSTETYSQRIYTPSDEHIDSPRKLYKVPNRDNYVALKVSHDTAYDNVLNDTGDILNYTKSFIIPFGMVGEVILPEINMAIVQYNPNAMTIVNGIQVYGFWIAGSQFSTSQNETRSLDAGEYVVVRKNNPISALEVVLQGKFEIDEPIGFDDFKMSFNRSKYHGISAEVSETNLEFYGEAISIIKTAYQTDIDSEITYEVYSDQTLIYSGKIDLSTYQERQAEYQSISVKVGEVGVKTTFNNRLDTEVDLNTPKTIEGEIVESPEWKKLNIPIKHLLFTNYSKQAEDNSSNVGGSSYGAYVGEGRLANHFIVLPIGNNEVNEFGTISQLNPYAADDVSNFGFQYTPTSDHIDKYGENTQAEIDIHIEALLLAHGGWNPTQNNFIRWHLELADNSGNVLLRGEEQRINKLDVDFETTTRSGTPFDFSCDLKGTINAFQAVKFYIRLDVDLGTATEQTFYAKQVTIKQGSFFKMKMFDTIEESESVKTDMLFVHDALNIISHCISENQLAVKSDWYGIENTLGGGALKALTNGYHIRGLFSDANNERNMPLSFKKLIDSLNALDCIGWGFDTENGETCVRVERWDWFYKDNVVLTLANVAEVVIDIDPDRIISELQIGYKKYATTDQYNSIDSPHGTRTFVNGIKAVSKTETQECDFIADNYAIEETRRARQQKNETEESRYDENIFVFELIKKASDYEIGHTGLEAELVGNEREFINAKLTPRQMVTRWKNYLFATQNSTPFKFTSGEINYKSSFFPMPQYSGNIISLQIFEDTGLKTTENDPITYLHAKYKAEKITFSYPLTIAQYEAVKVNPYGLISVNGMLGWILDFKYSFADGMADFTLLAKY